MSASGTSFAHPSKPLMFSMVVTPMDEQGNLDEDGIRRHLRRMVDAGIGVYLGSGGSGDGHSLEVEELGRLYQIGVEECKGKIPVYCNPPESRTAKEMLRKANQAIDAGVDLVQFYQVDMGHGRRPAVQEQEGYYRDLLEATDYPCAISIHPSSGFFAPTSLVARLCNDYPQIKVVNYLGGEMRYVAEVRETVSDDVKVYVGMATILQGLVMGAWGAQVTETNQVPNLCQSVIDHYLAGDMEKTREAYRLVLRVTDVIGMGRAVSSDGPKGAFKALGHDVGPPRRPRIAVDDATVEKMREAFAELNILELEREAAERRRAA